MIRKLFILMALFAVVVFADTVNVRPVNVGPAPGSEASLQSILDNIYGCTDCVDAANDQEPTALWQLIGVPPRVTTPLMEAKYSAAGDPIGIYSDGNLVNIFTSLALPAQDATIRFNPNGTIDIGAISGCGTAVNCGNFAGISQAQFGFYLNIGSTNYFSEDSRNGTVIPNPATHNNGTARVLAYRGTNENRWALAFEDGTDFDYNDRVISIESITPTPEPGVIILFGGMIALCATVLRRRTA